MLMAGFLPFSAIYIELYYIFASVWGHKVIAPRNAPTFACLAEGNFLPPQLASLY